MSNGAGDEGVHGGTGSLIVDGRTIPAKTSLETGCAIIGAVGFERAGLRIEKHLHIGLHWLGLRGAHRERQSNQQSQQDDQQQSKWAKDHYHSQAGVLSQLQILACAGASVNSYVIAV